MDTLVALADDQISIRKPQATDLDEVKQLFEKSQTFLWPWITPPKDYVTYLNPKEGHFFVSENHTNKIVGRINLNNIIRFALQQAFLGYYVFYPFYKKGYMSRGINLVLTYAFEIMDLHRVEANIQPINTKSIKLIKKCGFRKEGFSPNYLKIDNDWKDHERWALTLEDWEKREVNFKISKWVDLPCDITTE